MTTAVRNLFESFFTKWAALPNEMEKEWEYFKTKYEKKYEPEEDKEHMKIFTRNMEYISTHNAAYEKGEVSSKLAMNKFGDMSDEELGRSLYGAGSNVVASKNDVVCGATSNGISALDIPDEMGFMNKSSDTILKRSGHGQYLRASNLEIGLTSPTTLGTELSVQFQDLLTSPKFCSYKRLGYYCGPIQPSATCKPVAVAHPES